MTSDLPDSGEPGIAPPTNAGLPRPAMWPAGAERQPFDDIEEDTETPAGPGRRSAVWLAVGLMVAGAVLVGLAVVMMAWPPAVAGVLVGGVGAVLALRARIMEDVSVSDSPHA